jgi:NAD(P)-dependent dehydrogenase (short-subunit alcohol dehydrogenase family)
MDTNVLANIHLYNLFMPQIMKGKVKKVVVITSGVADMDWTNEYELEVPSLYAMSKAAMNMVTAKFNAQYKKDGVLFLSICPGMVDVGHFKDRTVHLVCILVCILKAFEPLTNHFLYSNPRAAGRVGRNAGQVQQVLAKL